MKKCPYRLILVTNRGKTPLSEYLDFIKICAESGITAVQLREKNGDREFILEFGHSLKKILDPLQIPLIINDSTDLAVQLQADGVHLGQADGDPFNARTVLSKDQIIGLSIETTAELLQADSLPVDYVAASAVFATSTKQNTKTLWGLEGLVTFVEQSKHPVVAIGGINFSNVHKVMETGVCGIAVIGVLHQARNPGLATRALRQIIDGALVE
jgi:thiamine-phosphate pyrophosphorylase